MIWVMYIVQLMHMGIVPPLYKISAIKHMCLVQILKQEAWLHMAQETTNYQIYKVPRGLLLET